MSTSDFESRASDEELDDSSVRVSKNRKHRSSQWTNSFINKSKPSSSDVIDISDSDSDFETSPKKRKQSGAGTSKRIFDTDSSDESTDLSSSSDSDFETSPKKRKKSGAGTSKRIFEYDELDDKTKEAKSAEKQSIQQRKEKDILLASVKHTSAEIVLDINKSKNENIVIHSQVAQYLKPHQIDGIKHMYSCCYGNVDKLVANPKPKKGSGCILAHCMGLGKTLQLIALLHTVINYPEFATNRILILCPKSVISNWKSEINKWIGSIKKTRRLRVFEFSDSSAKDKQLDKLTVWSQYSQKNENAACFLLSYESFRSLVFYGNKKNKQAANSSKEARVREVVQRSLLNATDLVVCDEGHMIKNLRSITSQAVVKLQTSRRIVLTGTPMQNNLLEYHAMVDFVKPSFLGNVKEFRNIYANPIEKGQHKDSTPSQIKLMRMQSFNLNRELESFVHRREVSFLTKELPKKFEFVVYIPMSEVQANLYEYYLNENPYQVNSKKLFSDYSALRKIWTHPKQLEISYEKMVKRNSNIIAQATFKAKSNGYETYDEEADNQADDQADDQAYHQADELDDETLTTSINHDWWRPFVTDEDLNSILQSPKFEVMLEILKECQKNSEKCLIFSASVICLNIVEFFFKRINSWRPERDYYRLDGSTKNFQRSKLITDFNKPENTRVKVFLISAKAGGQGINLTAANRIILLDTSWNPAVDQQSIFRIFRYGQRKSCYIYRLLSMGTMEEKIYSRSVTKQAMSYRVVDKQQIDRHFNMAELEELYTYTKPDISDRETPIQSKDELLDYLLNEFPNKVFKYHEHESLLDNENEEDMTEEEQQEAISHHNIQKNKNQAQTMAAKVPADLPGSSTDMTNLESYGQEYQQGPAFAHDAYIDDTVTVESYVRDRHRDKNPFIWSTPAEPSTYRNFVQASSNAAPPIAQPDLAPGYSYANLGWLPSLAEPSSSRNLLPVSFNAAPPMIAQPFLTPTSTKATSFSGKRTGSDLDGSPPKQKKLTDFFRAKK